MPGMRAPIDMTDDELKEQIRGMAKNVSWGASLYVDELMRRRAERQTTTLIRLTWAIVALTIAVVALTAVLVVRDLST
jgi:Zn-finger domain-containing protein